MCNAGDGGDSLGVSPTTMVISLCSSVWLTDAPMRFGTVAHGCDVT